MNSSNFYYGFMYWILLIKKKRFRELFKRLMTWFLRFYYKFSFNKSGDTKILEKKWDILIILDACRFDVFKKNNILKGKLSFIFSKGSHTREWLNKNFINSQYNDIVYVSANPMTEHEIKGHKIFYDVANLFLTNWNEKYGTVLPNSVSSTAIKYHKKYPNKRLIIHYMQPHFPYVGKTKMFFKKEKVFDTINKKIRGADGDLILRKFRYDNSFIKKFYKAYEENLKFVMESVKKILPELNGKVIISSDHGELFGEYGLYYHIKGVHVEPLIKVPWFEVDLEHYKK